MEYYPLDSDYNEIRLLTLLPSKDDSTIRCTLKHVSLINPPEYYALSYCWGDIKITKKIFINDIPVLVSANLESALRHIRSKGYDCLWVDAICINQEDKVEKSQQLLWMASIYRRAKEVEAWTGEEDAHSAATMSFLEFFNESFEFVPAPSSIQIESLMEFLKRPYWRRVWIIQELALARETTIHSGQHSISWLCLASAINSLSSADNVSTPEFANAENLVQFHDNAIKNQPVRFLLALKRSLRSLSTDPRDKVFALLGLVYDSGFYLPVPNYRQSIRDLSVGMTLSAISTTSSLDVVPLLGCGGDTLNLPSWCPNWFSLAENTASRPLQYLLNGYMKESSRSFWHTTGGKTTPDVWLEKNTLHLRGIIIDEIDGLFSLKLETPSAISSDRSQAASRDRAYGMDSYLFDKTARSFTRNLKYYTPGWFEAFFNTMWSGDDNPVRKNSSYSLLPYPFSYWISTNEPWLLAMGSLPVGGLTLKERGERMTIYDKSSLIARLPDTHLPAITKINGNIETEYIANFIKQSIWMLVDIMSTVKDGTPMMSTRKDFIGWAHPRARTGDQICVLSGCTVPVILRAREEGGFYLVGDAFVQGIMGGQAAESTKEEDWIELELH